MFHVEHYYSQRTEKRLSNSKKPRKNIYDVVVVGAGHAGCEAALSSARLGQKTLMITINLSKIALMPCNPAIGGIGKGHLVREIDALGGQMAKTTDKAKIQIKTLNSSKGPAVRELRAQADKRVYESLMRETLLKQKNLYLKQGLVKSLITKKRKAKGVKLATGESFNCKAVIITAGTFLNGRIVIGEKSWKAGRMGEQPSYGLTESLKKIGIKTKRFQTATPPRIDGRTIDYSKMEKQPGEKGLHFSLESSKMNNEKSIPCYLTYTNEKTIKTIQKNMKHSPIETGAIESHGPRYCPSIDRKVASFQNKVKHPIFVEPEGRTTNEMYLQGLTTAMPAQIQPDIVKSVQGFENAHIVRFGYAVEYDYVPPRQVDFTLESKACENLFIAGQVIGTTGYEEAAALGLMAGINASRKINKEEGVVFSRSQAYIGVLVDDLITKGVDEPYRMFTSRAEYRLLLRSDNAHSRITPIGKEIGLVSKETYKKVKRKEKKVKELIAKLRNIKIKQEDANKILSKYHQTKTNKVMSLADVISRPHVNISECIDFEADEETVKDADIQLKYGGYIIRQETEIKRSTKLESTKIPEKMKYKGLTGLSYEAREKLSNVQPGTLGQASRTPGVTPADISVLTVYLKQKENEGKSRNSAYPGS